MVLWLGSRKIIGSLWELLLGSRSCSSSEQYSEETLVELPAKDADILVELPAKDADILVVFAPGDGDATSSHTSDSIKSHVSTPPVELELLWSS